MLQQLQREVLHVKNDEKARFLAGFFKTGKGQYSEGDVFYGLTVPQCRIIATKYKELPFTDIKQLLHSKVHEERLIALLILVANFKKATAPQKKAIFEFYLDNTKRINNWDLVDVSADKIVGGYLLDKPRTMLYTLAESESLWEKRIAIIATYQFIKEQKEYTDTFAIAELLLQDKHDLIHKAVGWMLREVGKRISQEKEEQFLQKHYKTMPRIMLRYAIERFDKPKQQRYLQGTI